MALDPGAEIFARFAHKRSGVTRNVVIDKNGRIAYLTRLFDREEFDKMKKGDFYITNGGARNAAAAKEKGCYVVGITNNYNK